MWIRRAARAAAWGPAIALALLAPAGAQASPELLPDLTADAPESPQPPRVERLGDGRDHLLVRFDGFVHNRGSGPLEIHGSQPVNGAMTDTWQRIYRADSSYRDDRSRRPPLRYEGADGHRHWHLMGAARYSLWDEAGAAEAAPAAKVGFCLLDSERVETFGPAGKVYTRSAIDYCGQGKPAVGHVYEGISAGWRDWYPADFPFQWVDVSDVAPGRYRLAAQMDPDNFVIESNEANNGPTLTGSIITVPGYVATPRASSGAGAQTIALGAQAYGGPGPAVFQIASAPAHGTLNVAPGASFASPQVVYTPQAGVHGTDTFTYTARDPASPFPLNPRAAAVSVTVVGPAAGKGRPRLLLGIRFTRRGRFLHVRGRATRSGALRVVVKKRARRLGSCRKRARSGRRFRCRIKLRRGASPRGAKAIATLILNGRPVMADTFRVPRRLSRG
jgi:hypothetical protein